MVEEGTSGVKFSLGDWVLVLIKICLGIQSFGEDFGSCWHVSLTVVFLIDFSAIFFFFCFVFFFKRVLLSRCILVSNHYMVYHSDC